MRSENIIAVGRLAYGAVYAEGLVHVNGDKIIVTSLGPGILRRVEL